MNGKIAAGVIVVAAFIVGVAVYYLQVYAFYEEVELAENAPAVELTSLMSGAPEEIIAENFEAIDADSSPIRYRACFTTPMSHSMLTETYEPYEGAVPLTGPGWFECYDAAVVGAALESGAALAFVGQRDIEYGIDRVVAITEDGHGYIWHQINTCGQTVYDGKPPPPGCSPPPGEGDNAASDDTEAEMPQEGE